MSYVNPATASHFTLSASSNATAGTGFTVKVTALDPYGNQATGYNGTVHITSSDPLANLPANFSLTGGTGTFSTQLKMAGTQTLTATDTASKTLNGTSNAITVQPAAASYFVVWVLLRVTAGTPVAFTVTAQDAYGNRATNYAGTIHFTSSDHQASLPANISLTQGAGTASALFKTAGSQTVTATDTANSAITGTSNLFTVNPGTGTHFTLSAPSPVTAGTAFNVTVTAQDAYGNTATGYTGTAHFTSSDAQASLPANATLTNGTRTFVITLNTAGRQTLSVTDKISNTIASSPWIITVNSTVKKM